MSPRTPKRLPARCNWNDWPRVRARYGLRVVEVIQGEGAETTLVVVSMYAGLLAESREPVIEPKPTFLGKRLAELYEKTRRFPGEPQRIHLKGGLRIDAIIGKDGMFRLQISREKVYPSDTEWKTILANLPLQVEEKGEPERF